MSGYLHMVEAVEIGDKFEQVASRLRNHLRNRGLQPVFELPRSGHVPFTIPVDDPKWHTSGGGGAAAELPLGQMRTPARARIGRPRPSPAPPTDSPAQGGAVRPEAEKFRPGAWRSL